MLIRTGKIAYVPEVLNSYRRHQETVTHRSIRQDTAQPQESLHVKALVFEAFPISANAIAGSLARSVLEYNELSERMNLKRPVLTANPQVGGPLSRIRSRLSQVRHAPSSLKILLVVNDMESTSDSLAAIDLAGALADEYTVFLCNAQPQNCDPTMVARVDNRVIFLEGTLGPSPWSAMAEQSGSAGGWPPPRDPQRVDPVPPDRSDPLSLLAGRLPGLLLDRRRQNPVGHRLNGHSRRSCRLRLRRPRNQTAGRCDSRHGERRVL